MTRSTALGCCIHFTENGDSEACSEAMSEAQWYANGAVQMVEREPRGFRRESKFDDFPFGVRISVVVPLVLHWKR